MDATTYLRGAWYDGPVVMDMKRQRKQLQDELAIPRDSDDPITQEFRQRLAMLRELARLDDMQAAFDAPTPF